jgi:hypothetical protein
MDSRLAEEFGLGMSPDEIAQLHHRSKLAIKLRLEGLGLIGKEWRDYLPLSFS